MAEIYNLEKIDNKTARLIIWEGTLNSVELNQSESSLKENRSTFLKTGNLNHTIQEGDLYPIGDGTEVITNPKIEVAINLDLRKIYFAISSRNTTWILPKENVLKIIYLQHELANSFYQKLTEQTFSPELEAKKLEAKKLLENIINFDKHLYENCAIEKYR
ncbi:MAG: hypothetical protein V1914_04180 [archaeon]